MESVWERITERFNEFWDKLFQFIPDLLVIFMIILSGFVAAGIANIVLKKAFRAVRFDDWADGIGLTTGLRKAGISAPPSNFIRAFAYWFILVLFFMAGFATLGYRVTDALSSLFFLYIPRFFSAVVVVVLGYFIANFLARSVLIAGVNAGIEYSRLLSESVRIMLFILAFSMALEQLGIAPNIVFAAFTIFFGSFGLAAAIAFGAAGKDYAKKVIERFLAKRERNDTDQL